MEHFDFAIAGAGVFGAWLARALQLRGKRVTLFDPYGAGNSRASSGGETRIIRMGYGEKEIYTRWSWEALRRYREFFANVDPALLQTTGALWMCRPGEESAKATVATLTRCGVPHTVMNRREMEARFPEIAFGPCTWGVYEPDAGVLLARRGVQAVVGQTVRDGLVYRQEPMNRDSIRAGAYVYACGPWLPKLFPEVLRGRIVATRQEVLYFGVPAGSSAYRAPEMPCWVDGAAGMYGIPDVENRGFKVAIDTHGEEVDPDTQCRLVRSASVEMARAYLAERFPRLHDAPLVYSEVCQYENTADGDYLIDRHPAHDNVWLLGGGSGHGYKHGPVVGEYVASVLLDGAAIDSRFLLPAKRDYTAGGRTSTIPPK